MSSRSGASETSDGLVDSVTTRLRTIAAPALLAVGLLSNPWIAAQLLTEDGRIDQPWAVRLFTSIEFLCIGAAIFLLLRASHRTSFALGSLTALFLGGAPLTAYRLYDQPAYRLYDQPASRSNTAEGSQIDRQQVLQRVLDINESPTVALDYTTSPVLSDLHETQNVVSTLVPPAAVLDTAIGIDPLVSVFGSGTSAFDILVIGEDGRSTRVFEETFEVSKPEQGPYGWQQVTVDLSSFSGQRIDLVFSKRFARKAETPAMVVYDVMPEDLLFWRRPEVRPKRIADAKNVILVSIDTLRADHLGFMGYERDTSPNLDRLAAAGVAFTNCYSQAPWTGPSHFSMLTGTYPGTNGGTAPLQQVPRWWNDALPTMAGILRTSGYRTVAFTGKGPISAEFGFAEGFEAYGETNLTNGTDIDAIVDKARRWITRNRDRTFFLFLHTYEVHAPYRGDRFLIEDSRRDFELSKRDKSHVLEPGTVVDLYDGDIHRMDQALARLFVTLRERGLDENTLIVITSDHGEELTEGHARGLSIVTHGHTLYDELLHIPLILVGFEQPTAGARVATQVRSIDILPTLLDQLNLPTPGEVQGTSLLPLLRSAEMEDRPVFSEATTYGPGRMSLRSDNLKYIHRFSYGQLTYRPACCSRLPLTPEHELYDLSSDPNETINLAKEGEEIVARMFAQMNAIRGEPPITTAPDQTGSRALVLRRQEDQNLLENLRALGYLR